MIAGIGIDLVPVERVERLLERFRERFLERCFAPAEVVRPGDAEHLAGLLAAKEAAFKALGTGWASGVGWRQAVVFRQHPGEPPRLALRGAAAERAERLGVAATHLSITHAARVAAAVVVLEAHR